MHMKWVTKQVCPSLIQLLLLIKLNCVVEVLALLYPRNFCKFILLLLCHLDFFQHPSPQLDKT